MLTRFRCMDFPANDLTTVDIFDHVKVVMLTFDTARQICDIPTPDLVSLRSNVAGGLGIGAACFLSASMCKLVSLLEDAIEACL